MQHKENNILTIKMPGNIHIAESSQITSTQRKNYLKGDQWLMSNGAERWSEVR